MKDVGSLDVGFGVKNATTIVLIQLDVTEWVIESFYLPEKVIKNVWLKKGYPWFVLDDAAAEDMKNCCVQINVDDDFFMMRTI